MENGVDYLFEASSALQIDLGVLVARCSLWAAPELVQEMRKSHPHAAWFPSHQRARGAQKRGEQDGDTILDDNSKANLAIKTAIFGGNKHCVNFHACHIWPSTCYNRDYHTSIANLVLLPSALASLTDFDPNVRQILQFRAFELYHWRPLESADPIRPENYPGSEHWRTPGPPPTVPRRTQSPGDQGAERTADQTKTLIAKHLASIVPGHYLKQGRSLLRETTNGRAFFIACASLNKAGSYWFDIYDERLSDLGANGELIFGFADLDLYFSLRDPLNQRAFLSLKASQRPGGGIYRQVYFRRESPGVVVPVHAALQPLLAEDRFS